MAGAIPFGTDAWIKQLGVECNRSEAYREAAKNWEGDFYFIVDPDEQGQAPVTMYMDLYHGQCRQAYLVEDSTKQDPEFQIRGTMRVWQAIAQQKIDPVKALLTRQLSVQGNMAKIMRNVRAANELVNCTTKVDTKFPAD